MIFFNIYTITWNNPWGRRGRDGMVVVFPTTCAINAYHHWCCMFEFRSWQGVLDTTLCDQVCQWLATCRWFFYGHFGFLHQWNWPPRYNWNIIESGVKHHNPNAEIAPKSIALGNSLFSVKPNVVFVTSKQNIKYLFYWFGMPVIINGHQARCDITLI